MNENKTLLLPEQMRAIARYEITFTDAVPVPEDYDDIEDFVTVQENYQYTLEDLYAAVRNIIEKNPTVREFGENWYYPVCQFEEEFGIDTACDDDTVIYYNHDDVPDDCVRGLPVTREDVFAREWCVFEDIWADWANEEPVSDISEFQRCLQEIERYFSEEDLPIDERTFTELQKKNFIRLFETDDKRVAYASELELKICRKFTEELCEEGYETALRLKGYSCYGGNRLYPCDWPASRDCMLRLYEMTDYAHYANILGYIYYYGRCTNGEPEYEKAFEMFSVSARNGHYEGTYKLGDMLLNGYGCKKSPSTARNLYGMVYEDSRKNYIKGQKNCFADTALRMGNVYLRGINECIDPVKAYLYYLQADFAHRRRMKEDDFFGFTTVAINIRKSLDETREKLGEDFFRKYIEMERPRHIFALLGNNNRIRLSVEKQDDGEAIVRAKRVPVRIGRKVPPILLTEPELDWCELTDEVSLRAVNIRTSFEFREDSPYLIDWAEWNWAEERTDFFNCDQLVGWITCDTYRLYGPEKAEPSGQLIRLATVRFQPNGRTYDYLCEDETVQPDDRVIVPGYSGETEVEVVKVCTRYESELGLPIERYKTVIRKNR